MRVLLVRARPTKLQNTRLPRSLAKEVGYVMPLGLAYIAAFLRKNGISVDVIDAEAEELSMLELRERMAKMKPDVVGITSMTPTIHDDIKVAKIAKQLDARVVIGGPQVNAMPEATLRFFPEVDFGILGEGEYPMFKLVEALNSSSPVDGLPGVIYRDKNGEVVMKPPYIHYNLDELPLPAKDLLPYQRYSAIISRGRLSTICSGRGCPFHCAFCFKQPSDKKIRYRDPKSVVGEIQEDINRYGVNEINFVSDSLTEKKDFIAAVCQELIDRKVKISWIAATRADCITPELLKMMKRAGCRSLRFGVESGSDKILKLMDKNINKQRTLQAFRWAREEGIETFAYLIIGYLYETEETIRETLDFVKKLKPDLLMYNIATPLPSTRLFEQAAKAGLVPYDYWERFLQDENYPRIPYLFENVERWVDKAYREFFFSPEFIFRKGLEIRPNNIYNYMRAVRGLLRLRR